MAWLRHLDQLAQLLAVLATPMTLSPAVFWPYFRFVAGFERNVYSEARYICKLNITIGYSARGLKPMVYAT